MSDPIRPELEKLAEGDVIARLEALEKAAKPKAAEKPEEKPADGHQRSGSRGRAEH